MPAVALVPCLPPARPCLPLPPPDILKLHLVLGDSLRARDIKEGETQLETALGQPITVIKGADGVSIKLVRGVRSVSFVV